MNIITTTVYFISLQRVSGPTVDLFRVKTFSVVLCSREPENKIKLKQNE